MPKEEAQVPPNAVHAEMAVLGSMMLDEEAADKAVEELEEADFYRSANRQIFIAAEELVRRRDAVDLVTITEALKKSRMFGPAGGTVYLTEVLHSVSTAAHIDHYVDIVKEKSVLRHLIKASTKVIGDCHREEKDTKEILDQAQTSILSVAQKRAKTGFEAMKTISERVVAKIKEVLDNPGGTRGVPTGWKDLDRLTGGFQKGDLILIAARPSQGKTALALNIAANAAVNTHPGIPVGVFSLEMNADDISTRLVSYLAGANLANLRSGYFRRDKWRDVTNAAAKLSESPIYIDDVSSLNILDLRGRARRLARELLAKGQTLGLIIIDYLQLIHGPSKRIESRQQEVSEISRGLKALARDLNVPVIALSQLNRRVEERGRGGDGKPMLSDLRESGSLEQDADMVAFIHRPGSDKPGDLKTNDNLVELRLEKNRNGPVGKVDLYFRKELSRFEPAAKTDGEPPAGSGGDHGLPDWA